MYRINGTTIEKQYGAEWEPLFSCDEPETALNYYKNARRENDQKRRYTVAARLLATMEQLPGFRWSNPV